MPPHTDIGQVPAHVTPHLDAWRQLCCRILDSIICSVTRTASQQLRKLCSQGISFLQARSRFPFAATTQQRLHHHMRLSQTLLGQQGCTPTLLVEPPAEALSKASRTALHTCGVHIGSSLGRHTECTGGGRNSAPSNSTPALRRWLRQVLHLRSRLQRDNGYLILGSDLVTVRTMVPHEVTSKLLFSKGC